MKKILMVCMGNICRSPIAEGIMKEIIKEKKLNAIVDSAGTLDYHQGEAPDPRAIAKAKQHGIDISSLIARPFVVKDFDLFDHIYVMDNQNYKEITALAKTSEQKMKVDFIMNAAFPDKNMQVPDPYYGGEQGFENVYQMILKACEGIAKTL